jgi:hypothetical protein
MPLYEHLTSLHNINAYHAVGNYDLICESGVVCAGLIFNGSPGARRDWYSSNLLCPDIMDSHFTIRSTLKLKKYSNKQYADRNRSLAKLIDSFIILHKDLGQKRKISYGVCTVSVLVSSKWVVTAFLSLPSDGVFRTSCF